MASAVIGALRVDLSANTAAFSTGLQQASQKAAAFGQQATRSFSGFRFGVQNAAFQVQDFAVQVAAGTSATRALSQQLPQLLGVFGAFGAVLGTVAAVAIPLFSETFAGLISSGSEMAKQWSSTSAVAAGFSEALKVLGDNLGRVATIAGTFAAFMAAKWVAGFVAATAATVSLSGALVFLRGALIRTGIGAIIVAAGELVFQFVRLVKATGGWGEALQLLGEVAAGVWDGIASSAAAIPPALASVWQSVKSDFFGMLSDLAGAWGDFANRLAGWAGAAGWGSMQDALTGLRDSADQFSTEMTEAWDGATAKADELSAIAKGKLKAGFDEASAAVSKLKVSVKSTEEGLSAAAAAGTDLGKALGGGGGAAGGAKKAADATDKLVKNGKQLVEDAREYAMLWRRATDSIAEALKSLATGRSVMDSLGGGITGIADALWGEQAKKGFDDLAQRIGAKLQKVLGGIGGRSGLSGPAVAGAGVGLASAAVGVLNRDSGQIGSGIGSAAGAVLGTFVPVIGTALGSVLGGVAGGFLANIFGGGDDKWKRISGTAFTGTTYATGVMTERTVNTENDEFHGERFAFQGVKALLSDFNAELREFVDSTGGTMRRGVEVVVNETRALKAITGALEEGKANRPGESREAAAERIAKTVASVMGIAASLVQEAGPPLTEAQRLWRETQKRFSAENVAILRELGFGARQIAKAQSSIRVDLAKGFERELLAGLIETGRASRVEIARWRKVELGALEERRIQAIRTAREIGASAQLVNSAFRAERKGVESEFRELLQRFAEDTRAARERAAAAARAAAERAAAAAEAAAERLAKGIAAALDRTQSRLQGLQSRLQTAEERRSDVLEELTSRVERARDAERSLLEARRDLFGGGLQPGGPIDRFRTLQKQFGAAIAAARGGDADAAGRAGGLASSLLEAGREVFASGTRYTDLFRDVNAQLLAAQRGLGTGADRLAQRVDALDGKTFVETSERSTKALLTALGLLGRRLEQIEGQIEEQTRQQRLLQQRQNAARGAA